MANKFQFDHFTPFANQALSFKAENNKQLFNFYELHIYLVYFFDIATVMVITI